MDLILIPLKISTDGADRFSHWSLFAIESASGKIIVFYSSIGRENNNLMKKCEMYCRQMHKLLSKIKKNQNKKSVVPNVFKPYDLVFADTHKRIN